jgi:HPt (histidine-containing phosphotransfer) domain-containing protein
MSVNEQVFDREAALAMTMRSPALLRQLVSLFMEHYPGLLDQLQTAISENDASQVHELAHRVKGAVSTFHAHAAYRTAGELEKAGKYGTLDHAATLHRDLIERVETLVDALQELSQELDTES